MQHIHISTGFFFVSVLGVLGIGGLIVWLVSIFRKPKVVTEVLYQDRYVTSALPVGGGMGAANLSQSPWGPRTTGYTQQVAPTYPVAAPQAPIVIHDSGFGGNGMLTGMLLGEAIAGNHGNSYHDTTVVHDGGYSHPSSSYDSSGYNSSSDSGFSYDSGGGSFDSGASGGFDAS